MSFDIGCASMAFFSPFQKVFLPARADLVDGVMQAWLANPVLVTIMLTEFV